MHGPKVQHYGKQKSQMQSQRTWGEVFLDNDLILLLIPASNDDVILWADAPKELLKPNGREGEKKLILNAMRLQFCVQTKKNF